MDFLDIVKDMLREIEKYLLAPRDRRALSLTCKYMYDTLMSVRLWGKISPTQAQSEALAFLRLHHTSYLNLPMSMGKTAVGLRLAMEETGVGLPGELDYTRGTIIIVAPKILWSEVWMREVSLMCPNINDHIVQSQKEMAALTTAASLEGKILFLACGKKAMSIFAQTVVPFLSPRTAVILDEVQKSAAILPLLYTIRTKFRRIVMMSADTPRQKDDMCIVLRWGPLVAVGRQQRTLVEYVPIYSVPHSEVVDLVPKISVRLLNFVLPRRIYTARRLITGWMMNPSMTVTLQRELTADLDNNKNCLHSDSRMLLSLVKQACKIAIIGHYFTGGKWKALCEHSKKGQYYPVSFGIKFYYELYILLSSDTPIFLYPEQQEEFKAADHGVLFCPMTKITGVDLSFISHALFFLPPSVKPSLYLQLLGRFARTTSQHRTVHISIFSESECVLQHRLFAVDMSILKEYLERFRNEYPILLESRDVTLSDYLSQLPDEVFLAVLGTKKSRKYNDILAWAAQRSGCSLESMETIRKKIYPDVPRGLSFQS